MKLISLRQNFNKSVDTINDSDEQLRINSKFREVCY